jgi:hypothetical protein
MHRLLLGVTLACCTLAACGGVSFTGTDVTADSVTGTLTEGGSSIPFGLKKQ